jgi:hypothetical protein
MASNYPLLKGQLRLSDSCKTAHYLRNMDETSNGLIGPDDASDGTQWKIGPKTGRNRVLESIIGVMSPRRKGTDWAALVEAIRAGAAYLGQGISYSYLRARTLLAGPKLFSDDDFGFALTICKWEAFGVAAQDLILMVEADHRDQLPADPKRRAQVLAELYRDELASEVMPEHRQDKGWGDLIAAFDTRLETYMSKPPLGPDGISIATAMAVLDNAPIESSVRDADEMMIVNNTAFRFIEYQAKMRKNLDYPSVIAELSARMST